MDRTEVELLPDRESWDWEDTYFDRTRPGGVSRGPAGGVLHGGGAGQPTREGAEAIHARPVPSPARTYASVDHRRAGLRDTEPRRGRIIVPRLRRPLRARQRAGDEQPAVQRVGPDLPGGTDDGGAVGPPDASLPDPGDERRELPLPRVDEGQEGAEGRVKPGCRSCPDRLS